VGSTFSRRRRPRAGAVSSGVEPGFGL